MKRWGKGRVKTAGPERGGRAWLSLFMMNLALALLPANGDRKVGHLRVPNHLKGKYFMVLN